MKKLILLSIGIFFFGVMSYSQIRHNHISPKRAKIEANLIKDCRAVGLTTDAQISQLKAIFADANKKALDVKTNKSLSVAEKLSSKKAIIKDKEQRLATLMGGKENLEKFYKLRKYQRGAL